MENVFFGSTEQVIRITDPIGVDSAIDTLQSKIAGINYEDIETNQIPLFEKVLPLAELSESKEAVKNQVPMFRIQGERYSTMIPERVRSYCFFHLHSDIILSDGSNIHEYDMSIIGWGNQKKIEPNRFGLNGWFIAVLEKFFAKNRNNGILILNRIYRKKNEVWEGLNSVEFMPNDNPYFSFRMRFTYTFDAVCPVDLVVNPKKLCK